MKDTPLPQTQPELIDDGQEEVFSLSEVLLGRVEHKVSQEPQDIPASAPPRPHGAPEETPRDRGGRAT